jgi:F-type H+-transporting ATPase subunit delta
MAEIATIARPYAEALFRVAKSANLSAWAELVGEMAQAAENADVIALVQNPKISTTMVVDSFLAVLKSPVNQEAKNFINTLASYHRLLVLPEIAAQFFALRNAHEGAADAVISSAFALSDAQVSTLCKTLEVKFGRKLNPSVTVDTSLIGGVRVVVGDEVLDTSVRAKLQQMQIALTA